MSEKIAGILLSGGLDSSINGYLAKRNNWKLEVAFFFNYGQDAYLREKEAARYFADDWNIPLVEFDISALFSQIEGEDILQNPLLNVDLSSKTQIISSRNSVWVPNRNGIMINIAAAYLEKKEIKYLLVGFNREEAQTFPDNSKEFLQAINNSLSFSTLSKVETASFTLNLSKKEMLSQVKNDFLLEKVWSCYFSRERMCGKCESCLRLKRALEENGLLSKYQHLFEG